MFDKMFTRTVRVNIFVRAEHTNGDRFVRLGVYYVYIIM